MKAKGCYNQLLRRGYMALLAACFLGAAPAYAVAANYLEEKMNYERHLEKKVEDVLANLIGPGKSRVMIRAAIDFSTRENLQTEKTAPERPQEDFTWRSASKAPDAGREILPGFVDDSPAQAGAESSKVLREIIVPQSMVKRLTVSLVLSESLPETQAQKVRQVVSELLALDTNRGDEILVMRAAFAPIWYNSDMMQMLIKYGMVGFIAVIGMIVVGLGFLRMAAAMRAMGEGDGGTRIRMEMAGEGSGAGETALLPEDRTGRLLEKKPEREQDGAGDSSGILDIKPDKLEVLVLMLSNDEPADIALIAAHLPRDLRSPFISMLPPQVAAEVVASVAKVRFMEPDMLARIKEEIENRLNGAFGGYSKAVELIEAAGLTAKSSILRGLEKTHPDVAAAIRSKVLLLEDIEGLEDKDFALLAGAVSTEIWGVAAWRLSEQGREKLRSHLTERAWQGVQQLMAYGTPSEEKSEEAALQVMASASRLMTEGRIKRPARAALPGLTGPAAA